MSLERERKLLESFGLEPIDPGRFPMSHRYISRGILFACRGIDEFAKIVAESAPFYTLTGIMPSYERIHLGTMAVIEAVKIFHPYSKYTVLVVADLESLATRDIPLDKAEKIALEYHIPMYIALGMDPSKTFFYFQSMNEDLQKIAFDAARKITISEFRAVYGTTDPPRILSTLYQFGDMLFPQLLEPMHGVIPVGLDQDPHIRLCRDYVDRTDYFKFKPIIGMYIRDVPSLRGEGKMSKSDPYSAIFIPEDDFTVLRRKVFKAFSGGANSLAEQRTRGADLSRDVPFKILQFIHRDDGELNRIAEDYSTGRIISGEIKEYLFNYLKEFMTEIREKFEEARELVRKRELKIIKSYRDLASYV